MKKKTCNFLFYISYVFFLIPAFMGKINGFDIIFKYLNAVAFGGLLILFIFNMGHKKYTTKKILLLLSVAIIIILNCIKIKNIELLKLLLIVINLDNVEISDFPKKDFYIRLSILCVVVGCYLLNLTENIVVFRTDVSLRYTLGFGHPNTLGHFISILIAEYLYNVKDRLKITNFVIPIIAMIFCFIISKSRSSLILTCAIITYFMFFYKRKTNKNLLKCIINNSFLIFTILSFILIYLYSNGSGIGESFNKLFSGRIKWMESYLNLYDINFFGNDMIFSNNYLYISGNFYLSLDNFYIYSILEYGIMLWIVLLLVVKKSFVCLRNNDKALYFILFGLLLHGLMENSFFRFQLNPFLIFIIYCVFFKKVEEKV